MEPRYGDRWLDNDGPSREKERKKNLEVLISLIGSNRAYGAFMVAFMDQEVDYPDGEHVMFLLYWLNRFIFPSASNCITMEWLHLAEGLSSYRDIATGPLILASIYRALREATVEPINLNVKGPLWMVQAWLQWTFPELRARKLRVATNAVPLRELLLSAASGKTTEECFTFFLCRRTRHAFQWLMNLKRGSPWFENRSICQGPRSGKAPLASENMDIFSACKRMICPVVVGWTLELPIWGRGLQSSVF
ncbi:formin-like protein 14 [Prunus yedoensis var. nudiflora]|uniref:Formin-like protein 14 n=1 Tax=Prunus yedoensis var. nudiflora TaxID=2094558 RepID=A0A314UJA4_PRUYE|nr:formin-like protein 14 [Prunus yedoensis var. nudiflora]